MRDILGKKASERSDFEKKYGYKPEIGKRREGESMEDWIERTIWEPWIQELGVTTEELQAERLDEIEANEKLTRDNREIYDYTDILKKQREERYNWIIRKEYDSENKK